MQIKGINKCELTTGGTTLNLRFLLEVSATQLEGDDLETAIQPRDLIFKICAYHFMASPAFTE